MTNSTALLHIDVIMMMMMMIMRIQDMVKEDDG